MVSEFVSITTPQLYDAYVAHLEGRLNTDAFCKAFLAAVGPFDIAPFVKDPATGKPFNE